MSTKNLLFQKDKGGLPRHGEGLPRYSEELHHAYHLIGDVVASLQEVTRVLEKMSGARIQGHPDHYINVVSVFTVGHSRELWERQKTRPIAGDKRFFIIGAQSYTAEAMNGLLKLLEEPLAGNHFFVLSSTEDALLPTLRSRLMRLEVGGKNVDSGGDWVAKFIKEDVPGRFSMIEKFLKENDEEGEDGKLARHKTGDILNGLERYLSRDIGATGVDKMEKIIRLKKYLSYSAPSPRLILEYLAFIC